MGAFTSPAVRAHAPACWFPLAHAEAIAEHPGLVLTAVADTNADAAARAAAAYGPVPAFTDAEAMLAAVQPELLAIATRTPGRANLIASALAAGVRALHVEKPLCNSMAELARLEAAFAAGDCFLTLGAIRRRLSPYRAALAHAMSGTLGRLLEAQVNLGAAPLFWSHPHAVDLLLAAADGSPVVDVSGRLLAVERGATASHIVSDPVIETATVRFASGLVGRIGRMLGSDLQLSCEEGVLAVEADGHRTRLLSSAPCAAYPAWSDWDGHQPGASGEGTLSALAELVACLDGDGPALATNARSRADTFLGQRLLFAIAQSDAEGGRPVSPGQLDPAWTIDGTTGGRPA